MKLYKEVLLVALVAIIALFAVSMLRSIAPKPSIEFQTWGIPK